MSMLPNVLEEAVHPLLSTVLKFILFFALGNILISVSYSLMLFCSIQFVAHLPYQVDLLMIGGVILGPICFLCGAKCLQLMKAILYDENL